jgi:predicted transcriptional regulator
MACINSDGSLSGAAKKVLGAMQSPTTLEDVSESTMLPLYRIRASVRELIEAGLAEEKNGLYSITATGRARLAEQSK